MLRFHLNWLSPIFLKTQTSFKFPNFHPNKQLNLISLTLLPIPTHAKYKFSHNPFKVTQNSNKVTN